MPKKGAKKAGGGKLAGMTEEERLLYLQQRAQAEEELARKKEEMLTKFLKDKLQKEERNTAVNLLKLNQTWRAVLRQTRAAELRSDIAVLSQSFERVLDRKDSIIKCLVSDLSEAEQQAAQARRSHRQCVEHLLALQQQRLAALQSQWSSSLQELSKDFSSDREQLVALQQQECEYLEDVSFAMQQHYSELDSEAQQEFQSAWDDIRNKSIEEKQALQVQRESEAEALWCQAQDALSNYNKATEKHRVAFETLRARDQSNTQEIDAHMKKLQRMQGSMCALRARLGSVQREGEGAAGGLRAGRDEAALQSRRLKAQMSRARSAARSRLAELCAQSNAAAKTLQGVIAKGEKLLRLAEMCRKLESEHEKVVPFYTSCLSAEEQSRSQRALEPPSEELAKEALDYADLQRFWQRHNKTLLERQSLEREKKLLAAERQRLQDLLRQRLDGFSVSAETLDQTSPVLRVSQPGTATAAAAAAAAGRQHRRHTVIEAAHVKQYTL